MLSNPLNLCLTKATTPLSSGFCLKMVLFLDETAPYTLRKSTTPLKLAIQPICMLHQTLHSHSDMQKDGAQQPMIASENMM